MNKCTTGRKLLPSRASSNYAMEAMVLSQPSVADGINLKKDKHDLFCLVHRPYTGLVFEKTEERERRNKPRERNCRMSGRSSEVRKEIDEEITFCRETLKDENFLWLSTNKTRLYALELL